MIDELVVRLHMFTLESIKNQLGYGEEDSEWLDYYEARYLETLKKMYSDVMKGFEE